jgi:hypothetical protein
MRAEHAAERVRHGDELAQRGMSVHRVGVPAGKGVAVQDPGRVVGVDVRADLAAAWPAAMCAAMQPRTSSTLAVSAARTSGSSTRPAASVRRRMVSMISGSLVARSATAGIPAMGPTPAAMSASTISFIESVASRRTAANRACFDGKYL